MKFELLNKMGLGNIDYSYFFIGLVGISLILLILLIIQMIQLYKLKRKIKKKEQRKDKESVAFLNANNELAEREIKKAILLIIASKE